MVHHSTTGNLKTCNLYSVLPNLIKKIIKFKETYENITKCMENLEMCSVRSKKFYVLDYIFLRAGIITKEADMLMFNRNK